MDNTSQTEVKKLVPDEVDLSLLKFELTPLACYKVETKLTPEDMDILSPVIFDNEQSAVVKKVFINMVLEEAAELCCTFEEALTIRHATASPLEKALASLCRAHAAEGTFASITGFTYTWINNKN